MIQTWWRRWTQRNSRRSSPKRGPARYRPELTALEKRDLMAVAGATNFPGILTTNVIEPPSASIAVGPTQVLEAVNSSVAIYDKATRVTLLEQSFADFFAPVRGANPTGFQSDPVALFDEQVNRFILAVLDVSDAEQRSFLNVAVSNSATATEGFVEMFRIETTQIAGDGRILGGDFPRIGRNADAIVFTLNMFRFPTTPEQFDHVQVISLDKSSLLDFNPATVNTFRVDRLSTDFSMAPTNIHDAVPGGPMWFVEENRDNANLRIVRMDGVLSGFPSFSDFVLSVAAYSPPTPPAQPGGASVDPRIDSRILNAAARSGLVVAAHNVGTGTHTVARWYQIDVSNGFPILAQAGDVAVGNGVDTYYPAIDIANNRDMGMVFLQSSPREFLGMYITGRRADDPPNVMQTPQLIKGGEGVYNGDRAGYSGIAVDPGNAPSFWGAGEFAQASANNDPNNWGTWIVNFVLQGTDPTSLISRPRQFVALTYSDVLLRPVDPSGLAFWSTLIEQGVPRQEIVRAITGSTEYLTQLVQGFYRSLLGRNADAAGLAGFVNFLATGGNSDRVQAAILASPEYVARNGGSNNLLYVRSLYTRVLGRPADAAGELYFARLLAAGVPRENVALMLVSSLEAKTRLVAGYYQRFLRRPADAAGLNAFASQLATAVSIQQAIVVSDGPRTGRNEDVIAAIVGSVEYFARI
jgi:hypothetical protein